MFLSSFCLSLFYVISNGLIKTYCKESNLISLKNFTCTVINFPSNSILPNDAQNSSRFGSGSGSYLLIKNRL